MVHDLVRIQYLHSSDHINELCVGSNISVNSETFIHNITIILSKLLSSHQCKYWKAKFKWMSVGALI